MIIRPSLANSFVSQRSRENPRIGGSLLEFLHILKSIRLLFTNGQSILIFNVLLMSSDVYQSADKILHVKWRREEEPSIRARLHAFDSPAMLIFNIIYVIECVTKIRFSHAVRGSNRHLASAANNDRIYNTRHVSRGSVLKHTWNLHNKITRLTQMTHTRAYTRTRPFADTDERHSN